jgi:redox-sensitive bicupin YhaK (pirin superfamily)
MIKVKRSNERGHANHGWLNSYHSFSFSSYYDPDNMHFSYLRVINDDIVAPDNGFGQHPHKNMEIFTYVLEGQLEHKDTLGTGAIIKAGDVQLMSTGYGVEHSEFNPSDSVPVHLLQIWVIPNQKDTSPTYQQEHFSYEDKLNNLKLIISDSGQSGSMVIKQDIKVYASVLEENNSVIFHNKPNRSVYLHLAKGNMKVNNTALKSGDAMMVTMNETLHIKSVEDSEFLLFDLPTDI